MEQLQDMSQDINRRFVAATTKFNRVRFGKRESNKQLNSNRSSYENISQQITSGNSEQISGGYSQQFLSGDSQQMLSGGDSIISQILKETSINSVIPEIKITNPNKQVQLNEIINQCKAKLYRRYNRVNERNKMEE